MKVFLFFYYIFDIFSFYYYSFHNWFNFGILLHSHCPQSGVMRSIRGVFPAIKFFYTHFWREGERSEKKITNFDKNNF